MVELMLATLVAGAGPMTNETKPDLVPLRVRVYAVIASVPCLAGVAFRLTRRAWARHQPALLAMPQAR